MAVQEALDADEHPDMLDFSDAADGLQRTTSNVSSSSDMQHSRHGGTLAPPPPPPHHPIFPTPLTFFTLPIPILPPAMQIC